MSEYVIFTDSTADLTEELIKSLDIKVIPLCFEIEGKEYRDFADRREYSCLDFYNKLRDGIVSKTAQINMETFKDIFEPYLKNGSDIIYIAFSSALSGTYQSSKIVVEELAKKYPERKIYTVDSLAASMGEALLVYYAALNKKNGMKIEELRDWIIENRLKFWHLFTVDDLKHLKRGGRVSSSAAFVGSLLGIKPILHVDEQGRLINIDKVRGRRKSLLDMADRMEKVFKGDKNNMVFISHGDCEDDAKFLANELKKRFKIKDVVMNFIGPIIGTHSGPGTVALFFIGNVERHA